MENNPVVLINPKELTPEVKSIAAQSGMDVVASPAVPAGHSFVLDPDRKLDEPRIVLRYNEFYNEARRYQRVLARRRNIERSILMRRYK